MPVQNTAIKRLLREESFLSNPDSKAALDALLRTDLSVRELRKAFAANKAFWLKAINDLSVTDIPDDPNDVTFFDSTDLPQILQRIGRARTLMSLRSQAVGGHEDLLKEIILAPDENKLRDIIAAGRGAINLFDVPLTSKVSANRNTEMIIADRHKSEIQTEAQYQLLIPKIRAAIAPAPGRDQTAVLTNLTNLLNEIKTPTNDVNFRSLVSALIAPATLERRILDQMTSADVGARIRNEIALEIFKRNIKTVYTSLGVGKRTLLESGTTNFQNNLPVLYQGLNLNDEEANKFKAVLGEYHLKNNHIPNVSTNTLLAIANETSLNQIKPLLYKTPPTKDTYLDHAVTQNNMQDYRETAAIEFLNRRISQITDEATLKALAETRSLSGLKAILENQKLLGMDGTNNAAAREALHSPEALTDLITAAHVRLALTSKSQDFDNLKALAIAPADNTFAQNFLTSFPFQGPVLNRNIDKLDLLTKHFSRGNNLLEAKKQALLSAAQMQFDKLSERELLQFKASKSPDDIKISIARFLGINPATLLNPLFAGLANETNHTNKINGISRKLAAYAHVAHTIAFAKTEALDTNNCKKIVAYINRQDPSGASRDLQQELARHLATLTGLEKQEFSARLAEILVSRQPGADYIPGKNTRDTIAALSQANTIDEFKVHLRDLGITEHDWVNEKTMESVQKAALQGSIAHRLTQLTGAPETAYPALMGVVKNLSLEHQKQMLKPGFLEQLVDRLNSNRSKAELAADIKDRLRCTQNQATKIAEEFTQINLIKSISNAEIAKQLLNMSPLPKIEEAQIKEINNRLNVVAPRTHQYTFTVPPNNDLNTLKA
ncbi:hypothetical protein [Legionella gresilensis]|uniref:hypothetical protein n=1 Tax=Legionella gresilensis TaxID=91823 RepID=UPI0010418011|nr:hypothetical protein [Legionella gresilensis]